MFPESDARLRPLVAGLSSRYLGGCDVCTGCVMHVLLACTAWSVFIVCTVWMSVTCTAKACAVTLYVWVQRDSVCATYLCSLKWRRHSSNTTDCLT